MPKENKLQGQGIYKLTEQAENDLREIWVFVAENDQSAADRLIETFFQKFQLLADNNKIGRNCDDLVIGIRMFPFKHYHIFYFPIAEGAEIYRVLHGKRDIEGLFEQYFEGLKE